MELALNGWTRKLRPFSSGVWIRGELCADGRSGSPTSPSRRRPASATSCMVDTYANSERLASPSSLRPRSSYGCRNKIPMLGMSKTLPASDHGRPISPTNASTASGHSPKSLSTTLLSKSSSAFSDGSRSTKGQHHATMQKIQGMDHSESDAATIRRAFREKMVRHYRNLVNAWCRLDLQRNGRCLFADVVREAKACSFVCSVQSLWKALDQNEVGYVRLEDIDPDDALLLQGFADVAIASCGSAENAWRQHFSLGDEQLRCRLGPFKQGARKIGYNGNIHAVFLLLNVDMTPMGIAFEDFALLDKWFITARSKRGSQQKTGIWETPVPAGRQTPQTHKVFGF